MHSSGLAAQLGQIAKKPPKMRFKNSWNWWIILAPATIWQVLNVKLRHRKRKLCKFDKIFVEILVKVLWVNFFPAGFSHLKPLCAVQHAPLSTRRHICAMGSHATYKAKRPCCAAARGAERRRHPVRRWRQHCGGGDARTTVITASLLLSLCTVFYILFFFFPGTKHWEIGGSKIKVSRIENKSKVWELNDIIKASQILLWI